MKLTLLFLAIIGPVTSKAQTQNHKLSYGFYMEVIERHNSLKTNTKYFTTVDNINRLGFGLGTSIFYEQTEFLSFSASPGFGFEEELLRFETEELKRGTISLKLPIHVLWRLGRSTNFRLLTGFTPVFGVLGGKDQNNDLNFKQFDLTADVGLSYYFDVGKISIRPEFKYSQSFIEGKSDDNSIYQNSIDSYKRNKFMLAMILTK